MTYIICWAVTVYSRIIRHFSQKQKCRIYLSVRESIVMGKLVASLEYKK